MLTALFGCASLCLFLCSVEAAAATEWQAEEPPVKKTTTRLADGRELIYYDSRDDVDRAAPDLSLIHI